jgi:hypothetical protein
MTDLAVFEAWPKTPRLRRDITITEKIDGTNGQISVRKLGETHETLDEFDCLIHSDDGIYAIKAGSRNRWVRPGADNAGFAAWVWEHANRLVPLRGEGRHYGEWWGQGIQRGYDMEAKVFSLFNARRWRMDDGKGYVIPPLWEAQADGIEIDVVPTMYVGPWSDVAINHQLNQLAEFGSHCNGFDKPEGIILYHHASKMTFKVLLENDELPKGVVPKAEREAEAARVNGTSILRADVFGAAA